MFLNVTRSPAEKERLAAAVTAAAGERGDISPSALRRQPGLRIDELNPADFAVFPAFGRNHGRSSRHPFG